MADKGNFGRRTWDKEEYAKLAKLRREAQRNGTQQQSSITEDIARDSLDFGKDLNKRQVITGNITGTRGKNFGFYCEACDLTFKDNLKYVDHLNSPQHLAKTGKKRERVEVTLEEVKERFEMLVKKLEKQKESETEDFDVIESIARKRKLEQDQKEQAKIKRRENQEAAKQRNQSKVGGDSDLHKLMGFGGFGTSKK